MIDIHFHCLPAVDDGPDELAEAAEMCRAAAAEGCEAIIATPHQNHASWPNDNPAALQKLLARLREAVGERPQLYLGAEIRVGSSLLESLRRPGLAGLLPLAGSRYLLLELPRRGPGPDPAELLHELRLEGWRPILAHPELIDGLGDDIERLDRLVAEGALLQVTAASLTGGYGRKIRSRTLRLLQAELIHFVASDAHGLRRRPPGLNRAREVVAARMGEETAQCLTTSNPRAVLADKPLPVPVAAGRS